MSREVAGLYQQVQVGPVLRGSDPEATREHLRVALALAVVVGGGAAFAKVILVSPLVWEGFYGFSLLALVGLTTGNGYWRGGLLAGYALVAAPVAAGLLVAHVDIIVQSASLATAVRSVGFGLLVSAVVAIAIATPGFVLGTAIRWLNHRNGIQS